MSQVYVPQSHKQIAIIQNTLIAVSPMRTVNMDSCAAILVI